MSAALPPLLGRAVTAALSTGPFTATNSSTSSASASSKWNRSGLHPVPRARPQSARTGPTVTTASIFTAILAGIVIGALGRLIIPGRQAIGWILTFVVGLLGAVIGGFLAKGMGVDVWWQVLLFQVAVAAVLVGLVSALVRGSVTKRRARM